MGYDFDDIDNYFVSNEFNIITPEILKLQEAMMKWISAGIPGAIIYGRPRIGKTRAILYIAHKLKEKYGPELPIFVHNSTDHISRDKYFYSEMLKTVHHPEYDKGTVSALKERLINAFISYASCTKSKKIILFIDEAYNFTEKDFKWLMDVYNNLNLRDIHMTVFLVGSEELLARKQALIMAKQHQIVGRFMVSESQFHGMKNVSDMSICLYNFDKEIQIFDNRLILTELYFPDAYKEGKKLTDCSNDLWDSFNEIKKENSIIEDAEIPMMYLINTIRYCLNTYGTPGKQTYFPTKSEWKDSIINSDYAENERMYYNVPLG